MYFICEDPIDVTVRGSIDEVRDIRTGTIIRERQRRVHAKFVRSVAPQWAVEEGMKVFAMKKMPTNVLPQQWMGFYDSLEDQSQQGWSDEDRKAIEAKLPTIDGVRVVEPPRPRAPWPAYDSLVAQGRRTIEHVVEKILEKVSEDGYSPAEIIEYEKSNLNRPKIIEALEALLEQKPEEEELIQA